MANPDERNRPADADEDEAVPLLTPEGSERSSSPSKLVRRPNLLQRLPSIQQVAQVTALQFVSINILWPFVPLGLAGGFFKWNSILVSIFNFVAIIPLSAAVSDSSENLADEFGDLWGALINATFGNAVELIIGILAVLHKDTGFAQSVMIGSILSDILFVLGCCFCAAAWKTPILDLNIIVSGSLSSLMIITAVALILPTALYSTFESDIPLDLDKQILSFSRGTALVLFILYLVYLYFEFVSHKDLFDPPKECPAHGVEGNSHFSTEQETRLEHQEEVRRDTEQDTQQGTQQDTQQDTAEDTGTSHALIKAFAALIASGAGIMACSHFVLDSIDETSKATGITRTFIATILIPIASNAPECATVVSSHSVDYSVGVIVGSILQIALFVIPVLVMLGWAVGKRMTLNFETFQTVILFLAILLVNHLLQNGKYTYMHGLMLVGLYAVIAVAFFLRDDIAAAVL